MMIIVVRSKCQVTQQICYLEVGWLEKNNWLIYKNYEKLFFLTTDSVYFFIFSMNCSLILLSCFICVWPCQSCPGLPHPNSTLSYYVVKLKGDSFHTIFTFANHDYWILNLCLDEQSREKSSGQNFFYIYYQVNHNFYQWLVFLSYMI